MGVDHPYPTKPRLPFDRDQKSIASVDYRHRVLGSLVAGTLAGNVVVVGTLAGNVVVVGNVVAGMQAAISVAHPGTFYQTGSIVGVVLSVVG